MPTGPQTAYRIGPAAGGEDPANHEGRLRWPPIMGGMQALEDYVAELLAALEPLPAVVLPLAEAHGLVLAEDATAALPVPCSCPCCWAWSCSSCT